jgi:hypothetical protein
MDNLKATQAQAGNYATMAARERSAQILRQRARKYYAFMLNLDAQLKTVKL